MVIQRVLSLAIVLFAFVSATGLAQKTPLDQQSPAAQENTTEDPVAVNNQQTKLFEAFSKSLTGAVLSGNFTMDGQPKQRQERYTIRQVTKMPTGDYWLFEARITYGDHDVTVPMPLQVKWAGNTPVITLDKVRIPSLGTFDARVLIDGNRYAGTWQHDKVGGLLFGKIERPKVKDVQSKTTETGE